MKVCTKCGLEYPLTKFYKEPLCKNGIRSQCKDCDRARSRKKRLSDPDAARSKVRLSYRKISENLSEHEILRRRKNSLNWVNSNRQKIRELSAAYKQKTPAKHCADQAKRRAVKLLAVPAWLSQSHKIQMAEIYNLSNNMLLSTGVIHHVDHIVPLQSGNVCGLHVPWNLQILTADKNRMKSNRLEVA